MLKKFFAALAVMIFIFSATPTTTFAKGSVVTAVGMSLGPKNAIVGSNFYKSFARQAAKIDALRQLIESLNIIYVEGGRATEGMVFDTVKTKITCDEKFWAEHFSKIEVAEIKFVDNGEICEVTVKATLK